MTRQAALAVAFSLAVIFAHLTAGGWDLARPDAMQHAAMAERWLTTGQYQGVVTRQTEVATLEGPVPDAPWPASYARPGFPLLLVGAFAALGPSDAAYQVVNVLSFCLLGWGVFHLSALMGGSRAGWCGVVMLALTGALIWEGIYSGLEMPFMALVVLCALVLLRATDWTGAVGAGALLAFVVFIRPTGLAFLPLALLLLPHSDRRRRALMGCFLGTATVLIAAGYLVESRISPPPFNPRAPFNHTAFNLMVQTARFPGLTLDTTHHRVDWDAVLRYRGQVIAKLARGIAETPVKLAGVVPFWLLILAAWGLSRMSRRAEVTALVWAASLSGLLLIIGLNLTTAYTLPRHFLPVVALLIPMAAPALHAAIEAIARQPGFARRVVAMLALAAVISYGAAHRMVEKAKIPVGLPAADVDIHLRNVIGYNEPVGTSYRVAHDVAWQGRGRAVVLPADPDECRDVVERLMPSRVLVIAQRDHPEVFARLAELFPRHEQLSEFPVEPSEWIGAYHVLRPAPAPGAAEP